MFAEFLAVLPHRRERGRAAATERPEAMRERWRSFVVSWTRRCRCQAEPASKPPSNRAVLNPESRGHPELFPAPTWGPGIDCTPAFLRKGNQARWASGPRQFSTSTLPQLRVRVDVENCLGPD